MLFHSGVHLVPGYLVYQTHQIHPQKKKEKQLQKKAILRLCPPTGSDLRIICRNPNPEKPAAYGRARDQGSRVSGSGMVFATSKQKIINSNSNNIQRPIRS